MKRVKVESNLERQFLVCMVTNRQFLAAVVPTLEVDLLETKYVQMVAKWCVRHYQKYQVAPGRGIEAVYHSWVENDAPQQAEIDAVHDFLEFVSAEYEKSQINIPMMIDEISKYLTLKRLGRLTEAVNYGISQGRPNDAVEAINRFRTVTLGESTGYNPLVGKSHFQNAFATQDESLFHFDGDAGRFFRTAFARDSLVGIQAPEKRGKTYMLIEFLFRGLMAGLKVAFFEVGDLSEKQLNRRLALRLANEPLWERQCREGIQWPTDICLVDDGEGGKKAQVESRVVTFDNVLDARQALDARKIQMRERNIKPDQCMFSVHSSGSINVAGIVSIMERWKHELDFIPEVVLVDYADILAPEDARTRELRDQSNQTWMALRRMSQEWHQCVIVPTQADAASYSSKTQTMANFTNDKRKNAHVTAMLGLNQSPEEKKNGIMRLNWLAMREDDFNPEQCLHVAQCIPRGMAMVRAVLDD